MKWTKSFEIITLMIAKKQKKLFTWYHGLTCLKRQIDVYYFIGRKSTLLFCYMYSLSMKILQNKYVTEWNIIISFTGLQRNKNGKEDSNLSAYPVLFIHKILTSNFIKH